MNKKDDNDEYIYFRSDLWIIENSLKWKIISKHMYLLYNKCMEFVLINYIGALNELNDHFSGIIFWKIEWKEKNTSNKENLIFIEVQKLKESLYLVSNFIQIFTSNVFTYS